MTALSTGVIGRIIEGSQPEGPVLQILSMRKIPSGGQERYRLLVSDGQWSSSFAMLAIQLNSKVADGEVHNNCLVKLNRYVCNTVQDNKKVLVILDLTVLASGDEVGGKLGNPKGYEATKQPQGQQQQPPQPAPTMNGTGGLNQQNNYGQQNNNTSSFSPSTTPSGGKVNPISQLNPYVNRWTIRARVTNKSNIRTWSNSRGEGKLFSMDLLDGSGEIRATAFNEQLDKFYDMIEVNKVYFISGCTLKTANKQYSTLNNDYELTFNRGTEVTPSEEVTNIPTMQFNFVPLDQLDAMNKDQVVDIIGVCKEAQDMSAVTQRSTGKELKKRDLQIVDSTNTEVRLTLWGSQAESFDGSQQPVVAVKGGKLSDFNGCSVSLLSSSCLQINPDIKEAHMLKGWYDNGGSQAQTTNLSNQRSGGAGAMTNFKMLKECTLEGLGKNAEHPDYYTARATVMLLRKDNTMYSSCPGEGCNKKVLDLNNGFYRCEKCNKEYDTFNWRLILSVNIADSTDHTWVTVFHNEAETLLGTTAQELGTLKANNQDAYDAILMNANFKDYNFRIRAKSEMYNDEMRVKHMVMSLTPADPREVNRRLISDINQMAGLA